jgi:hypothetical protein
MSIKIKYLLSSSLMRYSGIDVTDIKYRVSMEQWSYRDR